MGNPSRHIFHLSSVLTFVFFVNPTNAGIVVDSATQRVTKFEYGGTSTNHYFYEGSFNDLESTLTKYSYQDAANLAAQFSQELNVLKSAGQNPATEQIYAFVLGNNPNETPNDFVAYYVFWVTSLDTWGNTAQLGLDKSATTFDAGYGDGNQPWFFASLTPPPTSTVPEPSTAIAMGLLGVVGFAGNRRRRQVSAA